MGTSRRRNIAAEGPPQDKPLVWLHGEVKTPPLSTAARIAFGMLLRRLQRGDNLTMPQSRPMPAIGSRCNELRVNDDKTTWRLMYRIDPDAIVILEVFSKKTQATPKTVLDACKQRLARYDQAVKEAISGSDEEG